MIWRVHTYNSNLYTIKLNIKKANTAIMIGMKSLDDTLERTLNKNSHPGSRGVQKIEEAITIPFCTFIKVSFLQKKNV